MHENDVRTFCHAREAFRQGNRAAAERMLLHILDRQPRNKLAWLWLSAIVDDPARERECLGHVLDLDPDDILAWNCLVRLEQLAALRSKKPLPDSTPCPYCTTPIPSQVHVCPCCGRDTITAELPRTRAFPLSSLLSGRFILGTALSWARHLLGNSRQPSP